MDDSASQAVVASEKGQIEHWLLSLHCPKNIAGAFAQLLLFYRDGAAMVAASEPSYLSLPPALAAVAADACYHVALPHGRFQYRDDQYVYVDELEDWVRFPLQCTREEIGETISLMVCPSDPRLAVAMPLAWRVGFAVGWLSGLAVSQKDDAQAGMVVLAALVAPLLLGNAAGQGQTEVKLVKRGAKSRRSRSAGK